MSSGRAWWRAAALGSIAIGAMGCGLIDNLTKQLDDETDKLANLVPKQGVDHSSQTVGAEGGDITTEHGGVHVPEGVASADVKITVTEESVGDLSAPLPALLSPAAPPIAFTPHGTTFAEAVQLALFYPSDVENPLVLRLDDEQDTTWELVSASASNGVATVLTTHFSVYMVVRCGDGSADSAATCQSAASGKGSLEDLGTPRRIDSAGADCGRDACTGDGAASAQSDAGAPPVAELDAGLDAGTNELPPPPDDPSTASCDDVTLCQDWRAYCAVNDHPNCADVLGRCDSLGSYEWVPSCGRGTP